MFFLGFREGLESFLIVAISAVFLAHLQQKNLLKALYAGTITAIIACIILGFVLAGMGGMTPAWEGGMALAACFLVLWCFWHLHVHGPHLKQHITNYLQKAQKNSQYKAIFMVFAFTFLMIAREGIEVTVVMVSMFAQKSMLPIVANTFLGLMTAVILAAWVWKRGYRLNLAIIFKATSIFMLIFAVQLALYAFHEFSEGGLLPFIDNHYWHEATEIFGPSGLYGQILSYALLVLPAAYLLIQKFKGQNLSSPMNFSG